MKTLVFDLVGSLAHFRRADTNVTYTSYPFITSTSVRGLLGSILGMDEFSGEAWIGVQLLSPVRTRSQELSLLGKGFLSSSGSFNRPTAIELIIKPSYRIYYQGEHYSELTNMIKENKSYYHTYLGSAFAPVVPLYVGEYDYESLNIDDGQEQLILNTVVPSNFVKKLVVQPERQYGRVGAMPYEYLGNRYFGKTINVIYELNGKPITFIPKIDESIPVRFVQTKEGALCLW